MTADETVLDASYYLPAGYDAPQVLDVPMKDDDEVVTVELGNELPDSEDLISFLHNEKAPVKYWLAIASAYANRGLLDDAAEIVKKGLEVEEFKSVDVAGPFHTFLAWLYIKQYRSATTKDAKQSALFSARNSVKYLDRNDWQDPVNDLASAEIFYQQGEDNEALKVIDSLSNSKAASKSLVNAYASLIKAKIAFKRRKYHESLRIFQAILVEQPILKPDPRIGIGLCFWALKDKKLAVQAWERALQLDTKETSTAKLLLTLSKFDHSFNSLTDDEFTQNYLIALESLSDLIKSNDENPVTLLLLASYYYSKKDLDLVLKISEKIINQQNNPKNISSDANAWIARVHYERGNYTVSQRYFKEATESNPYNLIAHMGYVQSLYMRNEIQDAIFTVEGLITKHPRVAEFHYVLGMLYTNKFESSSDPQKDDSIPKAISALHEYIQLSEKNNEPIVCGAYLALSRFNENKDNMEALKYLSKAVELFQKFGEEVPSALLSNMGVFHFIQGNPESAQTFFKSAKATNQSSELDITLSYNLARSQELNNEEESIETYNSILEQAPGYIYSKMRLLFLEVVKSPRNDELDQRMDELLNSNSANLEVRAFYSWYLKKTNRGTQDNLENTHNKTTLTKYDSHDTYALISLANMYRTIAREIKPKSEQDVQKRKTSYLRAAQLFHKALVTDPKNAFAAQGIAIVFVEEKKQAMALEIFRRVRDAVDNYSVHVNLGHCLCELGQYAKAIQEYSIALGRFSDETKDARTLSLIGRAWFARGGAEKSLESYIKSLEISAKALEIAEANGLKKQIPSLQYNVAFVKFNLAQFVQKLDTSKRTVEDINKCTENLQEAIVTFNELAESKYPPVQPEILKQRVTMGSNTIKNQLERALKEQEEYEVKFQHKIEEARRIREVEKAKAELEEKKRKEEQAKKEAEMKAEYERLQEQAKEWETEREQLVVYEEEEKKTKKGKKKNAIVTDEEMSDNEDAVKVKRTKRAGAKRGKRKPEANGGESKEEAENKRRKLYKSSEYVQDSDSDEDLEDYDGDAAENKDDDDEDDALAKAEAKLDAQSGDNDDHEDEDEDQEQEQNGDAEKKVDEANGEDEENDDLF